MAKVKNPLMGMEAAGAIGDSLVMAKWKGVQYARKYVIPANPRTTEQTKTRDVFTFLNQVFMGAPPVFREPWQAYVKGQALTDRNAFIKFNIPLLREEVDISTLLVSPGVLGGYAIASFAAEGGTGQVTSSVEVPALPGGWSVSRVVFFLFKDQDPHEDFSGFWAYATKESPPYTYTFTGLESGDYVAAAYVRYMRPDGKYAYSPGVAAGVTVL